MLTTSGAVTVVETLPLRMLLPVAKHVTLPASIKFVASIVGPPPANEAMFQVLAFAFNHAVGYIAPSYFFLYPVPPIEHLSESSHCIDPLL